jgi:hypothetical protein
MRSLFHGLRLFRLALAVVIGVPVMLCVGVGALYTWLFGAGQLEVLAPRDQDLTVLVDGAPAATVPAGQHRRVSLPQGGHDVRFSVGGRELAPQSIDVASGFDRWFDVGDPDRCFADLDVTEAFYGDEPPTVEARFHGDQPYDLPAGALFSEDELPKEIREHEHVRMVLELPSCALADGPEPELLAALGF